MNIFKYQDYKAALRDQIEENTSIRGYKSKLALAAGCQKSFLSRVLSSHVHITPEHAVGLARMWGLVSDERDYFLGLVDFARAGSRELKDVIKEKLGKLKVANEDLGTRFHKSELPMAADGAPIYYSGWHFSAIHFLITIPDFRTPKAIARRLQLPLKLVSDSLETLRTIGLVQKIGDQWQATKNNIHIQKRSYLNGLNHTHWRQRAAAQSFENDPKSIHYTALYSLSRADFETLRQLMLQWIEETRKIVLPSQEEELVCMAFDLFVV